MCMGYMTFKHLSKTAPKPSKNLPKVPRNILQNPPKIPPKKYQNYWSSVFFRPEAVGYAFPEKLSLNAGIRS